MLCEVRTEGKGEHEDLQHLAHQMGSLMNKLMKSPFDPGGVSPDWAPAVDICEMADRYEVIVELAGMRRDDIEVYSEKGQLVITGWRRDPCPRERVYMHQIEIEEGQFRRRLGLPGDVDVERITARYRDGMLRIGIPKAGLGRGRGRKG